MTQATQTTATTSTAAAGAPSDFMQQWQTWHAARVAGVSAPAGELALVSSHFLSEGDVDVEFDDVPGHWSFDGESVTLRAEESDGLFNHGEPLVGTLEVADTIDPDGAEITAAGGVIARLARRGGTTAIRVWRADSEARATFEDIVTYEPDPRWVVQGSYRRLRADGEASAVKTQYTYLGIDVPYSVTAPGILTFTLDGESYSLPAYGEEPDGLFMVIADQTRGNGVDAAMRALTVPVSDATAVEQDVVVDLNRLRLFPCAFSDHFTCPLPSAEHTLPVRLEAGERSVRHSDPVANS